MFLVYNSTTSSVLPRLSCLPRKSSYCECIMCTRAYNPLLVFWLEHKQDTPTATNYPYPLLITRIYRRRSNKLHQHQFAHQFAAESTACFALRDWNVYMYIERYRNKGGRGPAGRYAASRFV